MNAAQHYECIVIGGGSGGYAAARVARETLDRVAIVDGAKELGGLCILRGCMPSKTLIYSAEVLRLAQHGKAFGLDIPSATVNMPALRQRKLQTIREFSQYRQGQLESDRFALFRSQARFIDKKTIELDDGARLSADRFVVATGSVVSVPPIQGLAETPFWTSDDILELAHVPDRVIVLGGGVVACELAQFLRRIGSEVTQIQRSPRILKEASPEASAVLEAQFRKEGIELRTSARLESVSHVAGCFTARFKNADGELLTAQAPRLLNALGRRPVTDSLGLDAADIKLLPSGHIACNSYQQTYNPAIYACGDVADPCGIAHVAILQGELAARHATGRPADPVHYDDLLSVIFTDPQIGQVGPNESQLRERGIDYIAADYPFDDHGKSILMEAKAGYVKVLADRATGLLLGAECVGKDGGELIHAMSVAVSLKADVRDLLKKTHWYHPTLSEIWTYPLEDIADKLEA